MLFVMHTSYFVFCVRHISDKMLHHKVDLHNWTDSDHNILFILFYSEEIGGCSIKPEVEYMWLHLSFKIKSQMLQIYSAPDPNDDKSH